MESSQLIPVLQLLRKYNLKGTEELLKKEANLTDLNLSQLDTQADLNLTHTFSSFHSERDLLVYTNAYENLKKFVEVSLDMYKHELSSLLYPVLIYMYIELVCNGNHEHAKTLLDKFGPEQEVFFLEDITKISQVINQMQVAQNELTAAFNSNKYLIQISRDASILIKRFLNEMKNSNILTNIINNKLQLEVYEGATRNRNQMIATAGGYLGEAAKYENRSRVYYGLFKEPEFQGLTVPEDDEEVEEAPDKPKKKKARKDPFLSKKAKSDPNAPPYDRMPLPELKEIYKLEKCKALREASRRVVLGPDCLPSICFYTMLNSAHGVICADFCEDSSLVAVGFSNSSIKVFSLTANKLRSMKPAEKLADIDREAVDVHVRMMDERMGETSRTLLGHSGPVYRVTFDPFRSLLLSCSEDGTVRLWSLHAWKCIVCYRGHIFPVWDVQFSPHGYYFATASHERTARLWATDHYSPLRIFNGHLSSVDCLQFHPNSNYIVTGSSDRTVRMWDCVTGSQVRVLTGHKTNVNTVTFSACGRFIASGSAGGQILIWDIPLGFLVAEFSNHSAPIHSLAFSRDGTMLASGALDCTLKLWDFNILNDEITNEESNGPHNPEVRTGDRYFLRSYATKNSPIISLHFTRRNLLLAVGMYESS
ncbi:TATA-box binding protein associated factor 5 [Arctopsyche grandis]|uniref:TATA-box binding protein associated factor 5 n=1 Tax=Arctopsyche grandis TaxID=121162 RepID=UPI00406D7769